MLHLIISFLSTCILHINLVTAVESPCTQIDPNLQQSLTNNLSLKAQLFCDLTDKTWKLSPAIEKLTDTNNRLKRSTESEGVDESHSANTNSKAKSSRYSQSRYSQNAYRRRTSSPSRQRSSRRKSPAYAVRQRSSCRQVCERQTRTLVDQLQKTAGARKQCLYKLV